jgi:hypothetical protein
MIRSILNFIGSIALVSLFIWFIQWYIKGHFGKYAIFFWLYTIISIVFLINRPDHNPNWPQHDSRTGAQVWESNYGK